MTAALEGGEWSAARPGRILSPGKTWYPFYRRLGGPQGRSGPAENLVPIGILSRTVQPVASRYTDWATLATCQILMKIEFSRQIFGKSAQSNFMKICPVGAELFHANGRTDITKLIVASRNFTIAPESHATWVITADGMSDNGLQRNT